MKFRLPIHFLLLICFVLFLILPIKAVTAAVVTPPTAVDDSYVIDEDKIHAQIQVNKAKPKKQNKFQKVMALS